MAAMPQFRLKLDVVPALKSILSVRAISHMLWLRHTYSATKSCCPCYAAVPARAARSPPCRYPPHIYIHAYTQCIRPTSHPQEYPAGQVLSEGLQNAEDAGASKFAFMLDLRRHAVPGLDPSLQDFSGPAFVLADDGRGFAGREWESLQHLHASKKRDSPSDIGSFGMGTRSYFHYSDIVLVASQNIFVGLDPLEIAGEEGGWMLDVTKEADEAGQKGVTMLELPHFDVRTGGSIFRLPLRRNEHPAPAAGRFGKEISEARAREMLEDFAKQLAGGEMLLFLTHVVCIELWLWEADAETPTLRERLEKVFEEAVDQTAWSRLPHWLSHEAHQSYDSLADEAT